MIETHLFGMFVPKVAKYLFLGTFSAKLENTSYDWYFTSKRNQFWQIMSVVYGRDLVNKEDRQKLFSDLKMAIGDVILECERRDNTSADNNLINIKFNLKAIEKVVSENKIEKIFFSSRMAETLFKRNFKKIIKSYSEIVLITLPSPSPRYAKMTKLEKIRRYGDLLPKLF